MIPLIISYDCNCSYAIKFWRRIQANYPELMDRVHRTRFVIPVVHLRDHRDNCEYIYGSYYLEGGGHFYGEQAESPWAEFNQLGGRTRQMSSGYRQDVLNEHMGDWNWNKVRKQGTPESQNCSELKGSHPYQLYRRRRS